MIKISILKNGVITNQAQFPSQPEVDAWLAKEIANESFGKSAWTETIPEVLDEDGITVITPEQTINHPAEFTVLQEDISAALAQEEINKQALKYLAETDWMIVREMETGIQCPAEVKTLRANARAQIVR